MKNGARMWLLAVMAPLLLGACGADEAGVPVVTVTDIDAELAVRAQGELVASESLPIAMPGPILAPRATQSSTG